MTKVDPRIDLIFKKIFGVEENKDLLISLVNSIVSKEDQIAKVTLLNPYNSQNLRNDKLSILDIKAESEEGKRFNIEIQITDESDYDKRALYYWGKLYTEQLKVTNKYSMLNKAIGIHLLNFTSIPNVKKFHNVFHITEQESGIKFFTDLELHTIELNKFDNELGEDFKEMLDKMKHKINMWLAFLTRYAMLDIEQNNLPSEYDEIKKAINVVRIMHLTKEEQETYESREKWFLIETNALDKRYLEGKEEGIQIGETKGKEEEKLTIAKNLIAQNIPLESISQATGISISNLEKIKSEL